MKTLAIMIRSHGTIPINFDYGLSVNEIFGPTTIDYRSWANIQMMSVVSLAKLGGICHGASDINSYARNLNNMRTILEERENVKNTEDLVNYVFGKKPKIEEIEKLNQEIFNISFPPEITPLQGYTIEKLYENEPSMTGLGIYYLSSNGFTGQEITEIKNRMQILTNILTSSPHNIIRKSQILEALRQFNIFKLFFIDLTCSSYVNMKQNVPELTEEAVNWLNNVMIENKVKGGNKKQKRKQKINQKIKQKERKKKTYKKKSTRRKHKSRKCVKM
jgi:hypothetical protein